MVTYGNNAGKHQASCHKIRLHENVRSGISYLERGDMPKIRKYLSKGLKDPSAALRFLVSGRTGMTRFQVGRLVKALGSSTEAVDRLYESINSAMDFHSCLSSMLGTAYFGQIKEAEHLYVMTRLIQPKVVIETGVAAGVSSAFILKALADNGLGILYSIDIPGKYDTPPRDLARFAGPTPQPLTEEQVGFAVPKDIKDRWVLKLGKSSDILPGLLKEVGNINMFLHDSEHTYRNMMFEFTTAWDFLTSPGLLVSHDISRNNSFYDFSKKVNRKAMEISAADLGVIVK